MAIRYMHSSMWMIFYDNSKKIGDFVWTERDYYAKIICPKVSYVVNKVHWHALKCISQDESYNI